MKQFNSYEIEEYRLLTLKTKVTYGDIIFLMMLRDECYTDRKYLYRVNDGDKIWNLYNEYNNIENIQNYNHIVINVILFEL
jgi:hypothetical protein